MESEGYNMYVMIGSDWYCVSTYLIHNTHACRYIQTRKASLSFQWLKCLNVSISLYKEHLKIFSRSPLL